MAGNAQVLLPYWIFQPVKSAACWLFGLLISSQSVRLPDESRIPATLSARISLMMGELDNNRRSSSDSIPNRECQGSRAESRRFPKEYLDFSTVASRFLWDMRNSR